MRIVIIEDEKLAAEDLAEVIIKLQPDAQIVKTIQSVKEGIEYFNSFTAPDLIFSDIQLGDGLSFDIFKSAEITTPIIFCTAYNEYALNAFHTTGIDYILKPIISSKVELALKKYQTLQKKFASASVSYESILELFSNRPVQRTSSLLVTYKDRIIPVKMEHIALFYIKNEQSCLLTFDEKTYIISKKMEELERICGDEFFRVNRQCLVNRASVRDAAHFFSRKLVVNLSVPFKDAVTISKEKTPQFLDWLARK